jgi:integrase
MLKTKTPGVYKKGARYVVTYRDPQGTQRKRSCKTYSEARSLKSSLHADLSRGEYRATSKVAFSDYVPGFLDSYQGRTRRGIKPETLNEYRSDLSRAVDFFGRQPLASIEPRHVKEYAAKLAKEGLAPNSVRLALAPLKCLFATAFEEGLIRSNPTAGVRIAGKVGEDSEAFKAKAMTPEQLPDLLAEIPAEYLLFFDLLSQTALRIGEAIALQWKHVVFGERPVIQVRRRLYKGQFAAPKSQQSRRDIPLSRSMAQKLWTLKGTASDEDLVFSNGNGQPLNQSNLASRVLKPAAVRAGLGEYVEVNGRKQPHSWVSFHVFRHTCLTTLFLNGWNAKQVQVFAGHHSPAFTLERYVHLLPDDLPTPTFFDDNAGAPGATEVEQDAQREPEAARTEVAS